MANKRLVTKLQSIGPVTSKLFLFCEFIYGSPEKAQDSFCSLVGLTTQENIIIEGKLG